MSEEAVKELEEEPRMHHERKLKHLELLQAEVGRFTSESLRIKTTTVPIVLAAAGLAIRIDTPSFDLVVLLLVVPVLLFWFLDGYVVKQQQLFRWRYNRVRLLQDSKVDFNMCVRLPQSDLEPTLNGAVLSREQLGYYCTLLIVLAFGILYFHLSVIA